MLDYQSCRVSILHSDQPIRDHQLSGCKSESKFPVTYFSLNLLNLSMTHKTKSKPVSKSKKIILSVEYPLGNF